MITFILSEIPADIPNELMVPNPDNNVVVIPYPEYRNHADLQILYLIEILKSNRDHNIITLSDVMINAMGWLVEEGVYPRDQVKIVIYENQKIERECFFNKDGVIENWRFGWFSSDPYILERYILEVKNKNKS